METEIPGLPRFDSQALRLLTTLAEVGYRVVWEKEWRGYDVIEKDIAASNALLAIVDEAWSCSTWMAIEASYAVGEAGSGLTDNTKIRPISIFVYPVASDAPLRFPFNCREHVLLDRSVQRAVEQIVSALPLDRDGPGPEYLRSS